jgi:hypothetical protein
VDEELTGEAASKSGVLGEGKKGNEQEQTKGTNGPDESSKQQRNLEP